MKFDIVKYINDVCQSYLQGYHTKAYVLSVIDLALDEDSWQRLCDGKEVVNDVAEANNQVWLIHSDQCIEDKTEAEDNETYTDR